jgi:hypothetical protein
MSLRSDALAEGCREPSRVANRVGGGRIVGHFGWASTASGRELAAGFAACPARCSRSDDTGPAGAGARPGHVLMENRSGLVVVRPTRCWRRQSRANPFLNQNTLLAGKMQGISSIVGSTARQRARKGSPSQWLTGQFPTDPSREFSTPLQGIKSDDQENFRADQKSCRRLQFPLEII